MAARTTTQVLHDHLSRRLAGDVDGDLEANYAADVIMLSSFSTFRGRDGIRQSAALLSDAIGKAGAFNYRRTVIEGVYGFLEWTAESDGMVIYDGADSFHVLDGRIVMQTVHYTTRESADGG